MIQFMNFQEGQKRFQELQLILRTNPQQVSDIEILEFMKAFSLTVQTNCEHAANIFLETIAFICYFRTNLTETLLHYPIQPMFYLGIEQSEKIYQWVVNYLKDLNEQISQNAWHGEPLSKESMIWLQNGFPQISKDLIEKVLQEERTLSDPKP